MQFERHSCIGPLSIKPFVMDTDLPVFHHWVTQPYAHYWGYQGMAIDDLRAEYQGLLQQGHQLLLGLHYDQPAFIIELWILRLEFGKAND